MRMGDVVSLAAGAMADRKFRAVLTILGNRDRARHDRCTRCSHAGVQQCIRCPI